MDFSVLLNSGLWARVAGLHPAQILRPQHMIALKMPPACVRLTFPTKQCLFQFWQFPCHATAWEITISATCCRLKCAWRPQKTNILTNRIFNEMQKTSLATVRACSLLPQYYFFWNRFYKIQWLLFSLIQMWSCFWEFSESGKIHFWWHLARAALINQKLCSTGIDSVVQESTP